MLTSALLAIIEDAGKAVLILTDGVDDAQLFSLRLTRSETIRQLRVMADSAANLPPELRASLATIDWDGWRLIARRLRETDPAAVEDALSFGVRALLPATLTSLRLFRKSHPQLFVFKP